MTRTPSAPTRYRALTNLTHRPTGTLVPAGQEIDLSHLTADEILLLMTMQVPAVEAITEDVPAPDTAQEEG